MSLHYHAVIMRENEHYVGYCLEDPQIKASAATLEECRAQIAAVLQSLHTERQVESFRHST